MAEENSRKPFGAFISEQRRLRQISQKDLAGRLRKEDGASISAQYLNDIEYDRRGPPTDQIIEELARVLELPRGYLYLYAGKLPPEMRAMELGEPDEVESKLREFMVLLKSHY